VTFPSAARVGVTVSAMLDLPPWVDGWCRGFLGARPVAVLFVVSHLSEVVGVRLADGREVVVKRRVDGSGRSRTCVAAQRLLAEHGFPCPMPLTGAVIDDGSAVHAEQFVGGGELETEDSPAAAEKSAVLLADLVRRLASVDLDPPLPNPEWVQWDALPDRQAKAAVPTWIEDTTIRVQAKLAACDLRPVLGHADWEAQNMRWQGDTPLAVHDWDSLAWLSEAALAGTAAGVFVSHGNPTLAPVESSTAFLHAYEAARGVRFSSDETEIAWAASMWVALHNARDELIYNRPKVSYDQLEAQHIERLTRANAT
jgi:Phosphotransferase enzyme family